MNLKPLAVALLLALPLSFGLSLVWTGAVYANNGGDDPKPEPEPPKPEPQPEKKEAHDDRDVLCSTGTEASVLEALGELNLREMVTKEAFQIVARGGDWQVVALLPGPNVCVAKVKSTKTKATPAAKPSTAEKRSCDEAEAAKQRRVCDANVYINKVD